MSKIIVALTAALALTVTLALAGASCSSNTPTPTGCVATYPDAGTAGAICAVAWSCNDDSEHYQVICDLVNGEYSCACSTDTASTTQTVVINAVHCDLMGGALPAASACGWLLQM